MGHSFKTSLKLMSMAAIVATFCMAVPLVLDLPGICSVLQSCLKSLHLYLLINFIILTIAVMSRFHHEVQSQPLVNQRTSSSNLLGVFEDTEAATVDVVSRSTWNPEQISNFLENERSSVRDKPLASSRFAQQKPVKTSPDGVKALKVSKPKKHETLENTWKTMTDGRHMPLTRHLRKSETFENQGNDNNKEKKEVKRSVTLKDRTNHDNQNHCPSTQASSPASNGKVRKEGALTHDELNRRVEAFIKKFNDDMRQQKQEDSIKITKSGYR